MGKYHTLLLDADNTLFDFDTGEQLALRGAFEARGIAFTPENVDIYEKINRAQWEAFERGEVAQRVLLVERFRQFGVAMGVDYDPVQWNDDFLGLLGTSSHLIDGAEDLCRQLSQHHRLAMATNGVAHVQWARFEASPLLPYFEKVYISEELGFTKPDRRFFDGALADMGVTDRAGVLMIGDTLSSDIRGGQNAGLDTLWYNPKGKGNDGAPPTYEVGSFGELLEILG